MTSLSAARQRVGGLVRAVAAQAASPAKSGQPAEAAAKVIAEAVLAHKPRTLPDRTFDRLNATALRPHLRAA